MINKLLEELRNLNDSEDDFDIREKLANLILEEARHLNFKLTIEGNIYDALKHNGLSSVGWIIDVLKDSPEDSLLETFKQDIVDCPQDYTFNYEVNIWDERDSIQ